MLAHFAAPFLRTNPLPRHLQLDGLEVVVSDPDPVLEAVDGLLVGVPHGGPAALGHHGANLNRTDTPD